MSRKSGQLDLFSSPGRHYEPRQLLAPDVIRVAVSAYLEAADFTDDPGYQWSRRTEQNAARDVRAFFRDNAEDILQHGEEYLGSTSTVKEIAYSAANDFWLSRNGHGAGFFDRGTSRSDKLQKAAKRWGSCTVADGKQVSHIE